jgi:hypothetical protein
MPKCFALIRTSLMLIYPPSLSRLPSELRRRFNTGTFFFDLPDGEARAAIWNRYRKQFVKRGLLGRIAHVFRCRWTLLCRFMRRR